MRPPSSFSPIWPKAGARSSVQRARPAFNRQIGRCRRCVSMRNRPEASRPRFASSRRAVARHSSFEDKARVPDGTRKPPTGQMLLAALVMCDSSHHHSTNSRDLTFVLDCCLPVQGPQQRRRTKPRQPRCNRQPRLQTRDAIAAMPERCHILPSPRRLYPRSPSSGQGRSGTEDKIRRREGRPQPPGSNAATARRVPRGPDLRFTLSPALSSSSRCRPASASRRCSRLHP